MAPTLRRKVEEHNVTPKRKTPMSSRERTRLFCQRQKQKEGFNIDEERERTKLRVSQIRKRKKGIVTPKCSRTRKDPSYKLHKERDRKGEI